MSTVTLDFSKAIPIGEPPPSPTDQQVQALQGAMSYGVTQNPDKYAKLLQLQKQTGIGPLISQGNEDLIQQAADARALDYQQFAKTAPRTTAWASNPDNAAVSGVQGVKEMGAIEQNANAMRSAPAQPAPPSDSLFDEFWSALKDAVLGRPGSFMSHFPDQPDQPDPVVDALVPSIGDSLSHPLETLVGADTPKVAAAKEEALQQFAEDANGPEGDPLSRSVADTAVAAQKFEQTPLLSVSGTPTFQGILSPNSRNVLSRGLTGATKGLEGLSAPANLSLLATLPLAPEDAAPLISGGFAAQMAEGSASAGWNAIHASLTGDPGGAAEGGVQAIVNAVLAGTSGKHALSDHLAMGLASQPAEVGPAPGEFDTSINNSPYLSNLSQAIDTAATSELRGRAPDKFYEANQANFAGDPSLRIPADQFNSYFKGKGMDPQAVAGGIGSSNYVEAMMSGGDVEVPTADFLSKLDTEHQKALLPDVIDPSTGLTARQDQGGRAELEQWVSGGGAAQLVADMASANAETASTPEYSQVKEDLRGRYVAAGETPEVAETLATKDANVYTNLAREAGLKPSELLGLYNPKVTVGEAPEGAQVSESNTENEGDSGKSPELSEAAGTQVPAVEGIDGKATTLLTPARDLTAKYRLVEADSLIPSHNAQTFAKNAAYPEGLQERAYDTSKEAQARVVQQGQNYDSRYTVNTNPDAVNGPPVVTPDGIVLGGNSRAMSTQRHYAEGGTEYKAALKEQSATYGFTPEQVDGMDKPVLVRQVEQPTTSDDARRLGSELNKSMTGAMGVSERAVSAGKNLKPETLRDVANMMQTDDLTLREAMAKHGSEIVKMLASDGVITDRERPQFVDAATGGLSEEGKTFVERALMGSMIDDPRLMDAAPKSVLNKLERALGSIASFASRPDEWNLLPAIRDAVGELGVIQRSGNSVDTHLGQIDMFGGERNPLVDTMVRALDGKPNAVRVAFENFARDADENLPGQSRMFGEASAFDAFNQAFGSKLTEQEYHDGLETAAAKAPNTSAEADTQGDEGVSGIADHNATPGSAGGEGTRQLGDPLYQGQSEQPRGWFRTLPDGSFEIGKTKIGDLSTFVHEPAHAYLFMLRDLASRDSASDTLKGDYSKVLHFLGAKEGEPLTTEQHEKWAEANEQYLREGKAPSPGLRGVFMRFSVWLGSVYKKASDLGVHLSPEIRDVFDRMYAAEDGVNKATQEAGPQLFKTPEEAGWTDEQFKNYADAKGMSVADAKSEIMGKMNEAALRERTEAWHEEEKNVRQAVTDHIDSQPEYKAIHNLRKGELEDGTPLTMNRDALVQQFGEDRVKALQEQHPGLYRNEGGTDAETAAEIHGFSSGEEMMQKLQAAPRRGDAIDTATRDFMTAKHGDIRYDGSLKDEADLAVMNDNRAENLHKELDALRRRNTPEFELRNAERELKNYLRDQEVSGKQEAQIEKRDQRIEDLKSKISSLQEAAKQQRLEERAGKRLARDIAPIAAYREAAHDMVQSKAIVDLQPTRFLDASRKYGRESFDALAKGDYEGAQDAKHKELLNHFLFREATAEKDFVTKQLEPFIKRVQGKIPQQNLGKAGLEYRAQFNKLLARFEMAFVPRSEAPEGTLAEWASNQYDMGKEPAIDPSIYNETRTANYRSIPLSELHQVHDALLNIRALANQELHMIVNGRRVDFAEATASMIGRATASLDTRPVRVLERNATFAEKATDFVQRGDALLMRTERLMEWLDGGKTGPWHDNLWHLAADSQGAEYGMQEEVTKKLGDSLDAMTKEQRLKMLDKVTIPGINEPITRHDLVSMALNMGNDGNLDRLQKTFWAHGWNPDAVEDVRNALTREEWQHVQDIWDTLKPLGERMKELEKRLTGVPPAMVKPTPFHVDLPDGTGMNVDGGYYPIMMDPKYSKLGAAADTGMSAQNLMETGYGRAETSKGYTKGRTGFGGPLNLDYEQVLTQHTAKVVKDITHREFMLSANKLLMNQEIRNTLRSTLGAGYEEQMMPWLRTIINDRNGSATQGLSDFSRWMRRARTNMVMATIPFKIGTSLLQWTHAPRMLLSTNAGSFAQSLVNFMAHPAEMTQQIRELSPNEMKFRGENLDRDVRAVLNGQPGLGKKVAQVGNVSIKYTDHLLSFPLWHSVYQDALKERVDLPEKEAQYQAVQKADSAVRLGLGSASPKDLPPIMRNNDLSKFLTTFYSFHNGIYGQVRDIAHQVNGWSDVPKMTYGLALAVVVPSLVGSLVTGYGPKDGENVGLWAAKRALLFSADTIPLVRDVASAMDGDGDVKFNPLMNVLSKGTKAMQAATSDKDDKDWGGIGLNALETAGDLAGVPGTTQAVKPLRYLNEASKGKIDNPNVWDAVVGSAPSNKH